jgi:hypothetical protein
MAILPWPETLDRPRDAVPALPTTLLDGDDDARAVIPAAGGAVGRVALATRGDRQKDVVPARCWRQQGIRSVYRGDERWRQEVEVYERRRERRRRQEGEHCGLAGDRRRQGDEQERWR